MTDDAQRLKSELLANMGHELRNPLNSIIGFAELMYRGKVGPVSDAHKEYLGDILTSAKHLLELINGILDLAKVESGRMEFRPQRLDLKNVVGGVRDIVQSVASTKGIQIQLEIDPSLGQATLDPAKLKQVVYNYLSNAVKFTAEGGRVTVRVTPEDPGRFRVEVADTGIGIRPEHMNRLFVELQKLDSAAAGTGLGLALTKRIVEAQGGEVGARSEHGSGSTFWAILPLG